MLKDQGTFDCHEHIKQEFALTCTLKSSINIDERGKYCSSDIILLMLLIFKF